MNNNIGKLPKGFDIIGTKLYNHQLVSFLYTTQHPKAGLLLDLGLGKTLTAITSARYRIQFDKVKKVLVVCPTSLLLNWKNEIEKFSEYKAIILNSTKQERTRRAKLNNIPFSIINYESLFPLLKDFGILAQVKKKKNKVIIYANDAITKIKNFGYNMIIFDETAKYLKNHVSKRTIAAIALADQAIYKLILTGTLIGNSPLNLWPQFRVLDNGYTFGPNYYAFQHKYFKRTICGQYSTFTLPEKNYKLFNKRIYDTCITFSKDDCLDLPKRIHQTITLTLDKDLKKIYKTVEKQVISEIETLQGPTQLKITNILTKLLRLQQITSGYVSQQKGDEKVLKYTPKLDALMEQIDLVLEAKESIIVWCRFTKSIDLISETLTKNKIMYSVMDGRTKDKYKVWKGFQESKENNVFIGQVESGGLGIELFKINSTVKHQSMIHYENVWSPDVKEQAQGRIHRIGQNSICRYIDLIIENTIDEKILDSINLKQNIATAIMSKGIKNFLTKKGK